MSNSSGDERSSLEQRSVFNCGMSDLVVDEVKMMPKKYASYRVVSSGITFMSASDRALRSMSKEDIFELLSDVEKSYIERNGPPPEGYKLVFFVFLLFMISAPLLEILFGIDVIYSKWFYIIFGLSMLICYLINRLRSDIYYGGMERETLPLKEELRRRRKASDGEEGRRQEDAHYS